MNNQLSFFENLIDVYYGSKSPYENEVRKITKLIKEELKYIYKHLKKFNISNGMINFIVKIIVRYTIENADYYKGKPEEQIEELIYGFKTKYPWIIFLLTSYKVPYKRVEEFIRVIITFTLIYLRGYEQPDPYYKIRIDRIMNLLKVETDVFEILKYYNIPNRKANKIVREVVQFTIIYKDKYPLYDDYSRWTSEILREFIKSYPDIIEELKDYGMPMDEIRRLLRKIIRFTLKNDVIK